MDYSDAKQWVVMCTIKLQKKKEVSAILLHGILEINGLTVVLQVDALSTFNLNSCKKTFDAVLFSSQFITKILPTPKDSF